MTKTTDDQSVLGSLPDTRPTRFGRERGEGTKAKPKAAAKPKPKAAAAPKAARPRAVRAGAPSLEDSTRHDRPKPPPASTTSPPSGAELVTTAIQAAGELAQIGLAVGGRVLKRTVEKLPKP
jgi:hypothetical protein